MFFRYARLAENAGYGIGKIMQWKELTGEKVEIDSELSASTVTYWRPLGGQKSGQKSGQKREEPKMTTRERLLKKIKANPKVTRATLVEELKIAPSAIQKHINTLKTEGKIERVGSAKDGYWKVDD